MAHASETFGKGRHPFLRLDSWGLTVYTFIQLNPDCTWADVKETTGAHPQVLSDLQDHGLVKRTGRRGRGRTFQACPANATGKGRDNVAVSLTIFVNQYGEFSMKAALIGEVDVAAELDSKPRKVATKRINIKIPRPEEGYDTREIYDDNGGSGPVSTFRAAPKAPLTLEGDYTTL